MYLNLKNLRIDKLFKKLDWIIALYKIIERIKIYAYRLNTLLEIYSIFYISLLRSRESNLLLL